MVQIIVEADRTSLEIREVFPEDAGTYVVIAKNVGGESRTSCLLTLEGATTLINGELPLTGAEAPSRPIFIQPLQNKEVQEGSRAHLMCVVHGQPKPEVSPARLLITSGVSGISFLGVLLACDAVVQR